METIKGFSPFDRLTRINFPAGFWLQIFTDIATDVPPPEGSSSCTFSGGSGDGVLPIGGSIVPGHANGQLATPEILASGVLSVSASDTIKLQGARFMRLQGSGIATCHLRVPVGPVPNHSDSLVGIVLDKNLRNKRVTLTPPSFQFPIQCDLSRGFLELIGGDAPGDLFTFRVDLDKHLVLPGFTDSSP